MDRRRLAAALSLLVLASALITSPAAAIYGGTVADPGDYPAMALLLGEESGNYFVVCGGVLVGSTKVVTAAHCAVQTPVYAVLGETAVSDLGTANDDGEYHQVVQIDIHPGYATNELERDLAVLTLGSSADAGPVEVARPTQSGLWSDTRTAAIVGWGETGSEPAWEDLRSALVPIHSDAECGTGGSTVGCAGGSEGGMCAGDSGGPVLVNNAAGHPVLVGVIAYGGGACGSGDPGYFMRVGQEPFSSWLMIQLDVLAPRVSTATPTGTGVDRDGSLKAVFSEVMAVESLNAMTFKLFRQRSDGTWARVADVAVKPRAEGTDVVLNPFGGSSGRLAARTRYRAVVTTGAYDLAGNRLDQDRTTGGRQPKVWYFETGAD